MDLFSNILRNIVAFNDFLDLARKQTILQSRVSRWIPSASVQTPGCRLTNGFGTRFSGTSFLKTLLRTRKCFQKEQEFLLPILAAMDIQVPLSKCLPNFLRLCSLFFTSCSLFFNSTSSICTFNGALSVSTRCGKATSLNIVEILPKS